MPEQHSRWRCVVAASALATLPFASMQPQGVHCAASPNGSKPSDVFFLGGSGAERARLNSRNPAHIVACDVEIAGWLVDTSETHDPDNPHQNGREDYHYDIRVDPDFIAAHYGVGSVLWNAVLPGHLEQDPLVSWDFAVEAAQAGAGALTQAAARQKAESLVTAVMGQKEGYDPVVPPSSWLPFADFDTAGNKRGVTANSFLYPGNSSLLEGELNAWWTWTRPNVPSGWVPDSAYSDIYWPWNPRNPDGSGPLKPGDYIIMRGTLWEDGGHIQGWACSNFAIGCSKEELKCWNSSAIPPNPPAWPTAREMDVHGGWVEIHPVDTIWRAKRPPGPPKTARLVSVCGVTQPTRNVVRVRDWALKPDSAQPPNTELRYTQLIDGRFTDMRSVDTLRETLTDTALLVHLRTTSRCILTCGNLPARFKATYILWWSPVLPKMTLTYRLVSRTPATKTIVVQAADARSGQPLQATVSVYGITAPTGSPLTYPTAIPPQCQDTLSRSAELSSNPRGKPVPKRAHDTVVLNACSGIVSRAGYQQADFTP